MKYETGTHKAWLETCPTSDCNFKIHLKAANAEDIKEVLASLPEQGNKTKIKILQNELKRRKKDNDPLTNPLQYAKL